MTNPQQFGPDMQNRIAIGRVLFMVFMAVLFSSLLAPAAMLYFLCVLSFSVAVVSIMLAAYRGEQLWGPVLNR